jgi:hypothetical protein
MPEQIRAIYDDELLRPFLHCEYVSTGFNGQVCVYACIGYWKSNEVKEKLRAIERDFHQQRKNRFNLEIKVRSIIYSCTTVEIARKALPEFAEYLPDRKAVCTTLPAVTNVVTDLMLAGWKQPKADA